MARLDENGLVAEETTLRAFVAPWRRDRLASVVRTKKRYREISGWLSHGTEWDERWEHPLAPSEQNAATIERLLRAAGAPDTCHVLAGSGDVDGKDLPLDDALQDIVGSRLGTLVICIPGQLAYHEGEETRVRSILKRSGAGIEPTRRRPTNG